MKEYTKRNRAAFCGTLIFVLLGTGFAVVLQFFKGDVLDHAVAGDPRATIQYLLLLIAFILGEILFFFLYQLYANRFAAGCTRMLKADIFESILRRGYVAFREKPRGEYIAKLTQEADTIRERRFQMLPRLFEILFKIVLVSAALFLLDWRIALITILLLTTPLYVPKLIEKRLQRAQSAYLKAVETTLAQVNDWLSGFEIIKNFSVEKSILSRFRAANDLAMDKLLRDADLSAVGQLLTTLISYLSYFVVLVCAAWLVLRGEFTPGDFFVAIGMIDQLSYPLIALANIIRQMVSIRPAWESMERFMAEGAKRGLEKKLLHVKSSIEYRGVAFAYPGADPIWQDLSFTARAGEKYLIRGTSGCGKTTAVNLLLRYFDPTYGSILVDGAPITAFDSTYDAVTVVRQEAILLRDTLRNNLTMYREVPDEKLIDLLRALGLSKFANARALDGLVSENGANLSGGEKKRICLARALLRDTDVLILDEPLANLDEATARMIEDLLLSIRGKLLLVVSHQFSEEKIGRFDGALNMG